METTTPTAPEQFARDWLLVTENDKEQSEQLYADAEEAGSMVELSDKLREKWETMAEQVIDLTAEHINPTVSLYIAQMLQGWGASPFDLIARRVMEQLEESKK